MKKFNYLTLLFAALLVSGNAWGTVRQVANLKDLNSAVNASSSGDAIQLTEGWTNSDNITLTQNLTLDLNGFTIGMTSNKSIQSAASGTAMSVDSVIIKNGTVNGAGQIFFMRGMKKMTIENMTINNTYASGNYCISSATVDGTTLVLKGTNTFSTMNNKKPINIGKATTIENFSSGLTLSDINMGVAFSLNNQASGVLNIAAAPTNKVTLTNNGTVNISAGSFTSSNLAVSGNGTYNISGGTFDNAIWEAMTNKVIAQGKVAIEGESSVTIQDALTDGVAKINRYGSDIFFANLADAASAVKTGETITITKSYVEQQNITFTKACVVDLNGKQIEIYSWYAKSSDVDKSSKYFKVNADVEFKNGSLYAEGTTNTYGILYHCGNTTMTLTNVNIHSKHNNGCAIKFESANSQTLIINAGTTIKSDGLADIMKHTDKNNTTNDVSATIINNANLKSINIIDYNYDENYTKFVTFNVTNNAQIGKLAGYAKYFNLTNVEGASATLNITNYCHFTLNNAGTLTFAQGFFGSENTTETITNTGTIAITGGRYLQTWYTSQNLDYFVDFNSCQKYADQTAGGLDVFRILKSADARAQVGDKYYASVSEAMSFVPTGHDVTTVIEVLKDDTIPGRPSRSLCEYKKIQINMNGKKLVFSGPSYGLRLGYTSLDFEGIGELVMLGTENYESMFYMIGNYLSEKDTEPMNHLTIGKDIVVNAYGDATKVASDEQYAITMYYFGQQVDIHGTINCVRGIGNWLTGQGKIDMSTDYTPVVNIDGQLIAEQTAIFSENNGTFNISGDAVIRGGLSGIEAYSGVFNVTGGTIESTYSKSEQETKESVHGNTTTVGAGIVLYAKQVSDTIVVNLNAAAGKSVLVNGQMPIKVANPFNYVSSTMGEQISINVEMAKLKATNGQSVVAWAACDEAIAVSGGKFSHVPSYVVPGKTVINTPLDDLDHVIYPYMIGEVSLITNDAQGIGDIVWEKDNDWQLNGQSTQAIPVSTDKVTIAANQNVIVTGKEEGTGDETDGAFAYSIEIAQGGSLVVDSGAVLVVGGGGITNNNTDDSGILVKDGGTLLISPDATDAHPYGGVQLKSVTAKHEDGWEEWFPRDHRFQLIGIPTMAQPEIIRGDAGSSHGQKIYLNTWDVNNGWKAVTSLDQFNTPFKGYCFWNDAKDTFETTIEPTWKDSVDHNVLYTFKGNLVGNEQNLMQFNQDGYHFFANSYTAPIDIYSLLGDVEEGIQKATYLLLPMEYKYEAVDYAKLSNPVYQYRTIAPMEGFFFLKKTEGTGTAPIDYLTTVWSPAFPGGATPSAMAAARKQSESDLTSVRISLMDNTKHRSDNVYLMASYKYSAQEDISDTRKMMNPAKGVNIYAPSNLGNLSTMQTGDLEGQYLAITTNAASSYTLSFDWVKGEELYLTDHVTGQTTLMQEGNTYTFSATPNTTISDRFEIVRTIPGVVTNVVDVAAPTKSIHGIYTIMGQYVGESFDWSQLPHGVYVVNGQKVVK